MNIVLKPTSHPELGEIIIENSVFHIGQYESPFNSYKSNVAVALSRRHAKIFQENEFSYLVDLGSQNGTKVNGCIVKKKVVQLHDNDEICFGNRLFYKVEISKGSETTTPSELTSPIRLTLSPLGSDTGLFPIVVKRFPFLIGKNSEIFSGYKESCPEIIKFISRHHALFYIKENNLYIEDLGSTNGTFVSSVPLKEDAVLLKDQDIIGFGGNCLIYSVKIEKDDKEDLTQKTGTILVAKADSFLNIFCQQNDVRNYKDQAAVKEIDKVTSQPLKGGKKQKLAISSRFALLKKAHIFLREFKEAFTEKKSSNFKRIWLLSSIGVLLLLFSIYVRETPEQEIKSFLSEEKYMKSATLANRYLENHPENEQISALATESLLKYIVPDWTKKLDNKKFADAEALLTHAKDLSQFNNEGLKILELMEWIGKLENYVNERGGPDASVIIFKDEIQIEKLLEWWDRDITGYQRLLVKILRYVPSFENRYSRTFSYLRILRSEKSIYLTAIERLKRTIQEKLDENRAKDLTEIFNNFKEKYPKIGGLDSLKKDLENYLAIETAIREKNLNEVFRLHDDIALRTHPFQEKLGNLINHALPSQDILIEYQKASQAWSSGAVDQAIGILQSLTQKTWGEVAARKLQRYQKILEQFQALTASRNHEDYGDRLLSFYSALNPNEDTFFLRTLNADFQLYREKALKQAEEFFKLAQQRWNQYQENGRIGGVLRLESVVSQNFRQQAQLLSESFKNITQGIRIYDLVQLKIPPKWKKLHSDISVEIKGQRQWLRDLSAVLEPSLLKAKLQLFATPQEDSP